jgi:hypothetical protein
VLYTEGALVQILHEAGFVDAVAPAEHACRHRGPWDPIIPDLCLRVTARR